ncbi:hypothetical protein [Halalkalicoccus jeotgali]|uniref:hypothetical protein n=1 Tax=Halalkalicoccus jeotgali TaxID=413810 RepID=UPI0012DC4246|nr:hypothetical protein [Halalkalicoccus jeotgali]
MDWRLLVAGFVASVGFVIGWREFGSLGGAVLSGAFVSGLFIVDWLVDTYLYDL